MRTRRSAPRLASRHPAVEGVTGRSRRRSLCRAHDCPTDEISETAAGDVNGDGQADLLCITGRLSPDGFDVRAQPSPVAGPRPHRWLTADPDGNGRQDLVHVHFRNPGYEITTLSPLAISSTSTSHRSQPTTSPSATGRPDFIPADVGGGADGAADGRTDLVLVTRGGRTLQTTTLLSTGKGWKAVPDLPWRPAGVPAAYAAADVAAWRPTILDHTGRASLVHFWPHGPGVDVEVSRTNGDGHGHQTAAPTSPSRRPTAAPPSAGTSRASARRT